MFRFENPHAFYYLWLIPILIVISIFFFRVTAKKLKGALGAKLMPFLTSSVSMSKRRWKLFLQCSVLLFFIIALARPQAGQSKEEVKSEGVEIMILADVSESMMAEDARPNRLEQAKTELSRMVELMPGNKIGIIAFAGSATLLCPLTSDPSALKMYIDSLSTDSVSTQGTEFKTAIVEAEEAFKRGGIDSDETSKVTRVILVASDGEDHEPGALEEAEKIAKEGTHIFTLAYGTEKGAPIPERDGMGFLRGYKKDHSGQTVLTTVVGKELEALAQAGGGSFYHASMGGNHIQKIVDDVSQLEKTQFDSQIATQYDERFQLFVLLGILLGLLELSLGDRRPASRLWKGRYEVAEAEGGS